MVTIHLVSHTHWDREWYLTFQQFRLKLVSLVDRLLDILDRDPGYRYFMLDGQTVILDDYLQMRPEKTARLKKYIQDGRILVGPWHILPDEFLVSPEATLRNLLLGDREAAQFGPKMMVGYIPDPFGHLAQMPQILRGFGIETASVQRGLSDETSEFLWQAPDGSTVFMLYERDGYGNASNLPMQHPQACLDEIYRLADSLRPHSLSSHLLFMHGTDHMFPDETTSSTLAWIKDRLDGINICHSTLPEMIAQARNELKTSGKTLPVKCGELRDCRRSHLLPGVLSSRMWIKQQNHICENLLERWCEPFTTLAYLALDLPRDKISPSSSLPPAYIYQPAGVIRGAWRMLMECHPHDSICGCSIDQVHEEMHSRFDQVIQIGEELTTQSLLALAARISTDCNHAGQKEPAIVVFNPSIQQRTDRLTCSVQIPVEQGAFEMVDETGQPAPFRILERSGEAEITRLTLNKLQTREFLSGFNGCGFADLTFETGAYHKEGESWILIGWFKHGGQPDMVAWRALCEDFFRTIEYDSSDQFELHLRMLETFKIEMIASGVPGLGYRTYWIKPRRFDLQSGEPAPDTKRIENEYFVVTLNTEDGSISVMDKSTGYTYPSLNRFTDGGDAGDEYNYSPPKNDILITPRVLRSRIEVTGNFQDLHVTLLFTVPASLASDRQSRSNDCAGMPLSTRISLAPGVPRIDIHTEVENNARDHRLQVHFPVPFETRVAHMDGHFEIARRPVDLPGVNGQWIEDPVYEKPQRRFSDLSISGAGLIIANRGLPEASIRPIENGNTEIALTLLRCVGWLSRDDLATRRGGAGPTIETPGAQMLGHWSFDYAIIPHPGNWSIASEQAEFFDLPLRAIQVGSHPGSLPPSVSLVSIQPAGFNLTALKTTEDDRDWIIRGYNPFSNPMTLSIKPFFETGQPDKVRLDETPLESLSKNPDGTITCPVNGHEIITLRLPPRG